MPTGQDQRPIHRLPRLDGSLAPDAPWDRQGLRVANLALDARPGDPADFDAEAAFGWTTEGLAARVRVRGRSWRESVEPRRAFQHTAVELFLRLGSEWKNLVQVLISPGICAGFPEPRVACWDYRGDPARWVGRPPTARAERTRRGDGYQIDASIPWSNLAFAPEPGALCEIAVKVDHRSPGAARVQARWLGLGGEDFHRLRLGGAGEGALAQDRSAWATVEGFATVSIDALMPCAEAGGLVEASQGGRVVAAVRAAEEHGRAVAHCAVPLAVVDPAQPLAIACAGSPLGVATLPKLRELARQSMHVAAERPPWLEPPAPQWRATFGMRGRFVFRGATLPEITYAEPAVAAFAGTASTTVRFVDGQGREVREAAAPGRYGAIADIAFTHGLPLRTQQTLFRSPDGAAERAALQERAEALLPTLTGRPAGEAADEELAVALALAHEFPQGVERPHWQERWWWHRTKRALGLHTRYEAFTWLPRGYDADPARRWPAVLFLHGSGGHPYPPMSQRKPGDLHVWAQAHPDLPFVIFSLQSFGAWESPAVIEFLDARLRDHRIDPERIALMGFSMGGFGTWQTIVDFPERFAAAVPLAGGPGQQAEARRCAAVPIWSFNGDMDEATTSADARSMVRALEAVGGRPRFTTFPEADHGATMARAWGTPELWTWLAAQRSGAR